MSRPSRGGVRRVLAALLTLGLVLLVAGCGKDEPSSAKTPSARPSATASSPATPEQPAPKVGQCYQLDFRNATDATNDAAPVPCTGPHTAVTVYVGQLDTIQDGHQLAVDSKQVQSQLASTCPGKIGPWLGGTEDDQRLSRFSAVWFSPTLTDADAGASWFRCDLVLISADDALGGFRGDAKNALAADDGLDRFGVCGTAAPSAKNFDRVLCREKHSWRAVSVIDIAKDAQYLGKQAQSAGDDACKVEAQQRATDPLVYQWSFEWPSKEDWEKGRRYGLCWVPDAPAKN